MERMHQEAAIDLGLVRAKAYEIWQSLGCPDGAAEQTWLEAERQLKSPTTQSRSSTVEIDTARSASAAAPEQPTITSQSISSAPPPASEVSPKGKKSNSGTKRTVRR